MKSTYRGRRKSELYDLVAGLAKRFTAIEVAMLVGRSRTHVQRIAADMGVTFGQRRCPRELLDIVDPAMGKRCENFRAGDSA